MPPLAMVRRLAALLIASCVMAPAVAAQTAQNPAAPPAQSPAAQTPPGQSPPAQTPAAVEAAVAAAATQSDTFAAAPATLTLHYANRPIIKFRASVAGRSPADRVAAARQVLDRVSDGGIVSPVEAAAVGPAMAVTVGGFAVFLILPADIDTLAGETLSDAAGARRVAAAGSAQRSRRGATAAGRCSSRSCSSSLATVGFRRADVAGDSPPSRRRASSDRSRDEGPARQGRRRRVPALVENPRVPPEHRRRSWRGRSGCSSPIPG